MKLTFLKTINKILEDNFNKAYCVTVWLADDYDTMPDFNALPHETGISVRLNWRSPVVRKTAEDRRSLADAVAFISNIPKSPKPINKAFFAALDKDLYEKTGKVLKCKIIEGETEPETVPIAADNIAWFSVLFHREDWEEVFEEQKWW